MDKKYCYPNTDVLKNKLNLRDEERLAQAERQITARISAAIRAVPVKGDFDFKHLKAIHKRLFSDLYTWAGTPRTVDIAKGNSYFAVSVYIPNNADKLFDQLKRENYLIGLPREQAIERLAHYMGELNALHPFREGNGRTQRQFIGYLARATGLELCWEAVSPDRMLDASKHSMLSDNSRIAAIFKEIAKPLSLVEQRDFLKSISKNVVMAFDGCDTLLDRTTEPAVVFAEEKPEKADIRGEKQGRDMNEYRVAIQAERSKDSVGGGQATLAKPQRDKKSPHREDF